MTAIEKPPLHRILLWQMAVLALLLLAVLLTQLVLGGLGIRPAAGITHTGLVFAAFAGAIIQIIPNGYFAILAFRYRGAGSSFLIARSFYRGEVGKYVMTLVGFAVLFGIFGSHLRGYAGAMVFLSYLLMLIVQWAVVPGVLRANNPNKRNINKLK